MSKFIKQWVIFAKQRGICNETGNEINIGDKILYIPGIKNKPGQIFCENSDYFQNHKMHITGYKI